MCERSRSDSTSGDFYEKTAATTWTLRGNLRGPQGPQGPQGIQGTQGPQGNQGVQGPAGPGVPTGGATGTVLTKTSVTDYATAWQAAAAALPADTPVERLFLDLEASPFGDWVDIKDGTMRVPPGAGLGADPDPALIARYRTHSSTVIT